ncbi:unnamed protein product, partial [Amoebophrya sp. A120]|eukprot:GSA120T00025508001.1
MNLPEEDQERDREEQACADEDDEANTSCKLAELDIDTLVRRTPRNWRSRSNRREIRSWGRSSGESE